MFLKLAQDKVQNIPKYICKDKLLSLNATLSLVVGLEYNLSI